MIQPDFSCDYSRGLRHGINGNAYYPGHCCRCHDAYRAGYRDGTEIALALADDPDFRDCSTDAESEAVSV